jgi:peptidoglycan/xylan/chitin deacetylase (PgdA/CDA1 family)
VTLPVLLYHSVDDRADPRFEEWAVRPQEFAAQMELLARSGYRTLTVSELTTRLWDRTGPNRAADRPAVAITFDDAFADVHRNALPELRRHGFAATVFVPTAYVGQTAEWLEPLGEAGRPLMSWSEIREAAAAGIEIGGHTHTHVQLDALPLSRATEEIERSRRLLAERVGEVRAFAYPHGYHSRAVRAAVRHSGFRCACAVADGLASSRDDRYAISRVVIRRAMSLEAFVHAIGEGGQRPRRRPVRRAAWRLARRSGAEPLIAALRPSARGTGR